MARKKTDSLQVQEVQVLNPEFIGGLIGANLIGASSILIIEVAEQQEEISKTEKEEEEKKEEKSHSQ